jgi:hypothetical protein
LFVRPAKAIRRVFVAKPNYQFEKRQRDLAKKLKQEEKRQQKLANKTADAEAPQADQAEETLSSDRHGVGPGTVRS